MEVFEDLASGVALVGGRGGIGLGLDVGAKLDKGERSGDLLSRLANREERVMQGRLDDLDQLRGAIAREETGEIGEIREGGETNPFGDAGLGLSEKNRGSTRVACCGESVQCGLHDMHLGARGGFGLENIESLGEAGFAELACGGGLNSVAGIVAQGVDEGIVDGGVRGKFSESGDNGGADAAIRLEQGGEQGGFGLRGSQVAEAGCGGGADGVKTVGRKNADESGDASV